MKIAVFHDPSRKKQWGVRYWLSHNKPVRTFHESEAEAQARKASLERAFQEDGVAGIRKLDMGNELSEAVRLANESGKSILELVRLGLRASPRVIDRSQGPILTEAFNGFQKRGAEVGLRPKTVQFYREQLESFIATIGQDKRTSDVDRQKLRAWLDLKPIRSRGAGLRAVRAFFRWMLRQEPALATVDPTAGMKIDAPLGRPAIKFLSAQEATDLLAAAWPSVRPALALMLFAGIRHNELHRDAKVAGVDVLRWEDIDLKNKAITVRAEVSKTRVARTMRNLPANIWAWLPSELKGPVCTNHLRTALDSARQTSKISIWSKSILRHSFASHHVAAFEDLSATAVILRHESDIRTLNRHYREGLKLSKADGLRYFRIRPS